MFVDIFLVLMILCLIVYLANRPVKVITKVEESIDKQKVIDQLFGIQERQGVLFSQAMTEKDKMLAQKDTVISTLVEEAKELRSALDEITNFKEAFEDDDEEEDDDVEDEIVAVIAGGMPELQTRTNRVTSTSLDYLSDKSMVAHVALDLGTKLENVQKILLDNKNNISPELLDTLNKVISDSIC